MRYAVSGIPTGFDTGEIAGHLWNPSTSRSIYVVHASFYFLATSGQAQYLSFKRTTTIGTTPAVTVTPDADNAFDRSAAPPSGALLYLGNFATAPTQERTVQNCYLEARAGACEEYIFKGRGFRVGPGQGLGYNPGNGLGANACILNFTWDEP